MSDTEQIIIEFGADYRQLDGAIDLMVKLGQVDKATAEVFKKTSSEINNRAAALQNVNKASTASQAENKKAQKSLEDLANAAKNSSKTIQDAALADLVEGFASGVDDALKEAGVSLDEFENSVKNIPDALGKTEKGSLSLKSQLRQLKAELAQLEDQGKDNTKEFENMVIKAARLEDQISDTNSRIRALASDTRIFDGISQGVTGVVAGFTAAQGAAALFGDENKDLQETLVKLNAVMAISQGLQQIQTVLQKESAAIQLITVGQQKLSIIQTNLQASAESKNVIVKYASIAAQRILNALQAASPAGLLLLTIGALAAAYALLSDNTEDASNKQIKINEAQSASFKNLVALNEVFIRSSEKRVVSIESELSLAKARGESTQRITDLELQLLKAKKEVTDKSIGFIESEKGRLGQLEAQYASAVERLGQLSRAGALDPDNKQLKSQLEAQKGIVDNIEAQMNKLTELYKKQSEERTDITAKEISDQKKLRDSILTDQLAMDQALLLQSQEGSEQQKSLLQQIVKDQLAIDLANGERTAAQRKLLAQRANAEILAIERNFIQSRNELYTQVDLNDIDARLAEVEKGSEAELILTKQRIQVVASAEIAALKAKSGNTIEAQLLLDSQIKKINAETTKQKQALDTIYFESLRQKMLDAFDELNRIDQAAIKSRLAAVEQGTIEELQLKKDAIEAEADEKKLAVEKELISQQEKADKIIAIDRDTIERKKKLDKEYQDGKKTEEDKLKAEKEKSESDLKDAAISSARSIVSATFEIYSANLRAETDAKLASIQRQRASELSNKRLTEEEIARINEKYRQQERAIKRRAFQQEKDAALIQAAISGALAIVEALPDYIKAAAVAIAVAAQIAIIASKPVPQFAKGIERVTGPGTPTSDSIFARISVNERVVPADVNEDYFPALSAIHNRKVSPKVANALLADTKTGYAIMNNIPHDYHISEKDINEMMVITNNSIMIDEDKLAKKIAAQMDDRFYELISEVRRGNNSAHLERIIKEMSKSSYNPYMNR